MDDGVALQNETADSDAAVDFDSDEFPDDPSFAYEVIEATGQDVLELEMQANGGYLDAREFGSTVPLDPLPAPPCYPAFGRDEFAEPPAPQPSRTPADPQQAEHHLSSTSSLPAATQKTSSATSKWGPSTRPSSSQRRAHRNAQKKEPLDPSLVEQEVARNVSRILSLTKQHQEAMEANTRLMPASRPPEPREAPASSSSGSEFSGFSPIQNSGTAAPSQTPPNTQSQPQQPKVLVTCPDCNKQVTSQRNLARHRVACSALRKNLSQQQQATITTSPLPPPPSSAPPYPSTSSGAPPHHMYPPPSNPPSSYEWASPLSSSTSSVRDTLSLPSSRDETLPPAQEVFYETLEPPKNSYFEQPTYHMLLEDESPPSEDLPASIETSSANRDASNGSPTFQCDACQKTVASMRSLKRHHTTCKQFAQQFPAILEQEKAEADVRRKKYEEQRLHAIESGRKRLRRRPPTPDPLDPLGPAQSAAASASVGGPSVPPSSQSSVTPSGQPPPPSSSVGAGGAAFDPSEYYAQPPQAYRTPGGGFGRDPASCSYTPQMDAMTWYDPTGPPTGPAGFGPSTYQTLQPIHHHHPQHQRMLLQQQQQQQSWAFRGPPPPHHQPNFQPATPQQQPHFMQYAQEAEGATSPDSSSGLNPSQQVKCPNCQRVFCSSGNLKRHLTTCKGAHDASNGPMLMNGHAQNNGQQLKQEPQMNQIYSQQQLQHMEVVEEGPAFAPLKARMAPQQQMRYEPSITVMQQGMQPPPQYIQQAGPQHVTVVQQQSIITSHQIPASMAAGHIYQELGPRSAPPHMLTAPQMPAPIQRSHSMAYAHAPQQQTFIPQHQYINGGPVHHGQLMQHHAPPQHHHMQQQQPQSQPHHQTTLLELKADQPSSAPPSVAPSQPQQQQQQSQADYEVDEHFGYGASSTPQPQQQLQQRAIEPPRKRPRDEHSYAQQQPQQKPVPQPSQSSVPASSTAPRVIVTSHPLPSSYVPQPSPSLNPLSSIITTQPLPPTHLKQQSPAFAAHSPQPRPQDTAAFVNRLPPLGSPLSPQQNRQLPTAVVQHTPLPTEPVTPPIQRIEVFHPSPCGREADMRFQCPECLKTYSCRKNVKRHRMAVHKLTMDEIRANPAVGGYVTEEMPSSGDSTLQLQTSSSPQIMSPSNNSISSLLSPIPPSTSEKIPTPTPTPSSCEPSTTAQTFFQPPPPAVFYHTELAEADSTFHEEEELKTIELLDSKPSKEVKKKVSRPPKPPAPPRTYVCEDCNRTLSSDYSLKRHKSTCPKAVGEKPPKKLKDKPKSKDKETDESMAAPNEEDDAPDSTTLRSEVNSQPDSPKESSPSPTKTVNQAADQIRATETPDRDAKAELSYEEMEPKNEFISMPVEELKSYAAELPGEDDLLEDILQPEAKQEQPSVDLPLAEETAVDVRATLSPKTENAAAKGPVDLSTIPLTSAERKRRHSASMEIRKDEGPPKKRRRHESAPSFEEEKEKAKKASRKEAKREARAKKKHHHHHHQQQQQQHEAKCEDPAKPAAHVRVDEKQDEHETRAAGADSSDVTVFVGSVQFSLTKEALCKSSAYFATLFKRREADNTKVALQRAPTNRAQTDIRIDADANAFQLVLDAHSNAALITSANIDAVLSLSERLEFKTVRDHCESFVNKRIHELSVMHALRLADHFKMVTLKQNLLDSISITVFRSLAADEDYRLMSPALKAELLEKWGSFL